MSKAEIANALRLAGYADDAIGALLTELPDDPVDARPPRRRSRATGSPAGGLWTAAAEARRRQRPQPPERFVGGRWLRGGGSSRTSCATVTRCSPRPLATSRLRGLPELM